jgi:cytochrome c oxidase assembly factor CtaG
VLPLPAGAGSLSGYDGPPALTLHRAVTSWAIEPVVLAVLVVLAAVYLGAAARLRRRGDRWPIGRDIAFVVGGLGTILLATSSSLGVYDDTLFWVHMVQHMVLSMLSAIFLALGAPVTLALRTLPARPRRRLSAVLHSRVAAAVINPLVGFALLFGTPFVLYFTGLYEATLRDDTLHQLMHVHFVLAGCVFFWPLIGIDPVPGRLPYPMRLLLLFVSLPAHAWLGISIMSAKTVLAGDYYRQLARPWGPSLLSDQSTGGALLWITGDLVGIIIVAALFVQWSRADSREAVRTDRSFDRADRIAAQRTAGGGVDLGPGPGEDSAWAAYNARLAALARRDNGG